MNLLRYLLVLSTTVGQLGCRGRQVESVILGDRDGNGGDALICIDPKTEKKTVVLHDFYEAKHRYDFEIDYESLKGFDRSWMHRSHHPILVKMKALNPGMYRVMIDLLPSFCKKAHPKEHSYKFYEVPDEGHTVYPEHCSLKQVIVQYRRGHRDYEYGYDPKYFTLCNKVDDEDYLNYNFGGELSIPDQQGLILHELVYRQLFDSGQLDSENARFLTGLYASKEFQGLSKDEYEKTIQQRAPNERILTFTYESRPITLVALSQQGNYTNAVKSCENRGGDFRLITAEELDVIDIPDRHTNYRDNHKEENAFLEKTDLRPSELPILQARDTGQTVRPLASQTSVYWVKSEIKHQQMVLTNDKSKKYVKIVDSMKDVTKKDRKLYSGFVVTTGPLVGNVLCISGQLIL